MASWTPRLMTLLTGLTLLFGGCLGDTAGEAADPATDTAPPLNDTVSPTTPANDTTPPPDDTTAPPVDTTAPPVASICGSHTDPADGVALLVGADRVELVRADGAIVRLAGAVPEHVEIRHVYAKARAGFFAVRTAWGDWQGPGGARLTLYDSRGVLLATDDWPGVELSLDHLGHDGSRLVSERPLGNWTAPKTTLITAAGSKLSVDPAVRPLGPQAASGQIPATKDSVIGWYEPVQRTFAAVGVDSTNYWVDGAGRLNVLYKGYGGSFMRVMEGPETYAKIALPVDDPSDLWVAASNSASDWLLFGQWTDEDDATLIRVDIANLWADIVFPGSPAGLRPMEGCYAPRAALDAHGRMLTVARDDDHAWLQRFDAAEDRWEQLGAPLSGVDNIDLQVYADTVVVVAWGPHSTYCPPIAWGTASDEAVVGASIQVVAPGRAEAILVSRNAYQQVSVSEDGRCMAHFDVADDGTRLGLKLVDLASGKTTQLALPQSVMFLQ